MRRINLFLTLWILIVLIFNTAWTQDKGGRWQFEDNGSDTADWDNLDDSGALQGNATYHNVDPAEGTSYLWLDSIYVNDYFRIDDSDDLDFTNEDIGISAWIYPVVLNDVHYLVNKGDQFSNPKTTNFSLRISSDSRLEFLIRDSGNAAQKITSSFILPVNQWTFVATFYDYNAATVYMWNSVSSEPIDTLDFDHDFFANDDPLSIGSWFKSDSANPSVKDYQGRIDDVRISGTIDHILSPTHIASHLSGPAVFELKQNYPNPFNAATTISFSLPAFEHVRLDVYDILGRKITRILDEKLVKGTYKYKFNADNLPTGVYFYRMMVIERHEIKKMVLFK